MCSVTPPTHTHIFVEQVLTKFQSLQDKNLMKIGQWVYNNPQD